MKVIKLEFLRRVNDSGAEAVLDHILQLIAENYTIKIIPATTKSYHEKDDLPAFTVVTSKDGTDHGEGTSTWLMKAMTDAYEST